MATKQMQMYKCDRCGKVEYFEREVRSVGTKWGQTFDHSVNFRTVDLCPECLEKYKALTADFFGGAES